MTKDVKSYGKVYYQKNKEKLKADSIAYKKKQKYYYAGHPEEWMPYIKDYRAKKKIYWQTPSGRQAIHRRRGMGSEILNKSFDGCEGHHINETYIIHIPKELHSSLLGHNHRKPETMLKINRAAFLYLNENIYLHLVDSFTLNA